MGQYRTLKYQTSENQGANATLQTPAIKTEAYNHMRGKVTSSHTGTLNLQQSDDGVTWDTLTTLSIAANDPEKYDEICYAAYFRVEYNNGATATTTFRLSIYADPYS